MTYINESDSSIVKNLQVFSDSYRPSKVLYREDELKELGRDVFSDFVFRGKGTNVFIFGPSGVGKTEVCLLLMKEAEEVIRTRNLPRRILYLNIRRVKKPNFQTFIMELLVKIGEIDAKYLRNGLSTDTYVKRFYYLMEAHANDLLIILDEFDSLEKEDMDSLLYMLVRASANGFTTKNTTLCCIVNNNIYTRKQLSAKVRSSLGGYSIVFSHYTNEQITGIIEDRAVIGLKEGSYDKKVLTLISPYIQNAWFGDIRKAMELLYIAAKMANAHILKEDIYCAIEETRRKELEASFVDMHIHKVILLKVIVSLIKAPRKATFATLSSAYAKYAINRGISPLKEKLVWKHLNELEYMRVITKKGTVKAPHFVIINGYEMIAGLVEIELVRKGIPIDPLYADNTAESEVDNFTKSMGIIEKEAKE